MGKPRRLGVAVLAAGASRRFGAADKLMADFRGKPLGEHVVGAVPRALFAKRWVICAQADHPCAPFWQEAGFDPVHNPHAGRGMGTSAALAGDLSLLHECDGLLIALADMPLVPGEHYAALVAALGCDDDIIASSNGQARLPPAVFGKGHLQRLSRARGDEGARRWLAGGRIIACPHEWLADIDRLEDIQTYGQPQASGPKALAKGR